MTDKEFTLTTLYDDFFKIAKVNLYTGEYIFVKAVDEEADAGFFGTRTIDEYTRVIVGNGFIYEDDVKEYLHHTGLNYLQDKITHRQRRLVHTFRRKWGGYLYMAYGRGYCPKGIFPIPPLGHIQLEGG